MTFVSVPEDKNSLSKLSGLNLLPTRQMRIYIWCRILSYNLTNDCNSSVGVVRIW